MPLYKLPGSTLRSIRESPIDYERRLHQLVEDNLETLFGLQLVRGKRSGELSLGGLVIDTLAFDPEARAFVVLEYKKDRTFSIIDQGFAYLSLLINNKAEIILAANETRGMRLRRDDVDWSQSRVIFIAPEFTPHQRGAISFQDLPVELWAVRMYGRGLVEFSQVRAPEKVASIHAVAAKSLPKNVTKEVRTYSVDDHFRRGWDEVRVGYDKLSETLLGLDTRLQVRPKKYYIAFHIGGKNVFTAKIRRSCMYLDFIRFRPRDLRDPEGKVAYRRDSKKHYNVDISRMRIENERDIDYAKLIARQVVAKYATTI